MSAEPSMEQPPRVHVDGSRVILSRYVVGDELPLPLTELINFPLSPVEPVQQQDQEKNKTKYG